MPPGLLDSLKLHSSTSTSTVLRNACTYSIVTLIRAQVIRVEEWDCKKEGQWEWTRFGNESSPNQHGGQTLGQPVEQVGRLLARHEAAQEAAHPEKPVEPRLVVHQTAPALVPAMNA